MLIYSRPYCENSEMCWIYYFQNVEDVKSDGSKVDARKNRQSQSIYQDRPRSSHYKETITKIARTQSQFPHSSVCERFIYSHNRAAYSSPGKYVDRSWEYINHSQTHECRNWDRGHAIPRKGIHKWDFRCSALCSVQSVLSNFFALYSATLPCFFSLTMAIFWTHNYAT